MQRRSAWLNINAQRKFIKTRIETHSCILFPSHAYVIHTKHTNIHIHTFDWAEVHINACRHLLSQSDPVSHTHTHARAHTQLPNANKRLDIAEIELEREWAKNVGYKARGKTQASRKGRTNK